MTIPADPAEQASLLEAVKGLTQEVRSLRSVLARDYPKREEVTSESRRRAIKYMAASVAILLLAQIMTITTISSCFLGDVSNPPGACKLIPKYSGSVKQSNQTMNEFLRLRAESAENRAKVAQLELEVERLKNKSK